MTLKTRKTALVSAIAILLVVYIAQVFVSNKSTEKTFKIKGDITKIFVSDGTGEASNIEPILTLQKKDGAWVAGKKEFSASSSDVEDFIENLKELKAVSTVSRITNEVTDDRYGFSGGESFTVVANNGDKTVRSLTVGKASPTGEQFYFKIDNGNDVYMSAKNLKNLFYTKDDDIREMNIFDFERDKIEEITITNNSGVFNLGRDVTHSDSPWISKSPIAENKMLSQNKVSNLISKIRNVQAEDWSEGKADFSPDAILTLRCGEKTVTLQAKKDGDKNIAVATGFNDGFTISDRVYTALETKLDDLLEEKSVVQETQDLN